MIGRERHLPAELRAIDPARDLDAPAAADRIRLRLEDRIATERLHPVPTTQADLGVPVRRDSRRHVALAAAAVVIAAVGIAGTATLTDGTSRDSVAAGSTSRGSDTATPGGVACARAILEGDVVASKLTAAGRLTVTLAVTDWIKPDTGPGEVTYDLADSQLSSGERRISPLAPGDHVLVQVPITSDEPVMVHRGGDIQAEKSALLAAIPAAPTACTPDTELK